MQQQLKIKNYTPDASSYAPRIRNEQWERHKSLLKHLHDEGYKRADMLDIIQRQGFNPSMGQLNAKMTAWGFKVYGTHTDAYEKELDTASQPSSSHLTPAGMADIGDDQRTPSPISRHSISSMTLCEPEEQWSTTSNDRELTLDEVIILQALALTGSYWPSMKPSDLGFRGQSNSDSIDESQHPSILAVAEFLCAVHCFEEAFDLYHYIFEQLIARDLTYDNSVLRVLIQCASSATSDAQCTYVLSILRRAQAYCVEPAMMDLAACFASLSQDLCNPEGAPHYRQGNQPSYIPLLIAADPRAQSESYQKEWLKQQLSRCDDACSTLAHLSTWCQDTLSFFHLENLAIVRLSSTASGEMDEAAVLECQFQVLAKALIIDYLNSPGPSMRKANSECKESDCLFRWALSPSTSLVVMAHLLYEPIRLQSQSTENEYLRSRAQQFSVSQSTTALQELRVFASMDSNTRCSAFIDTYIDHFTTSLAFRRYVSHVTAVWDRMAAAKRLSQVLQSNQTGILPHAGLPSARRSVLKTMVAPFTHDQNVVDSRMSSISDSGSMGDFARLASRIGMTGGATGSLTPSDAMSIDTRSSWSFHRVTGFSGAPLSARNSLSSRRGDHEEIDEYRQFTKDSNYTQQDNSSYPDTPTQSFPGPDMRHD